MDSTRLILSTFASALLPILAVAQQPPAAPLPQDARSSPNSRVISQPNGPVAHLVFHVLQFDQSKIVEAESLILEFFPEADALADAKGALSLGAGSGKRSAELIAQLVDRKLATVVSRPQLMAIAEQPAEVQVGQQIDGWPTTDGTAPKPRQLGLTLQCVAHWLGTPNRMRLDIDCTDAKVNHDSGVVIEGKLYPAINKLHLETTLETSCGETILLHGPAQHMFVAVTPTWILDRQPADVRHHGAEQTDRALLATEPSKNADATNPRLAPVAERINATGPTGPVQQTGYSPQPIAKVKAIRPSMIRDLAQIRDAINKISGATILNISIDGDKLEVEIALADDAGLNELADALSSHGRIMTHSVMLSYPGTGAIISISGQFVRPQIQPQSRDQQLHMLRADLQSLRAELRQLSKQVQGQ